MLRITTIIDTPNRLRLQLEGRLVANWVNELLLVCGDLGGRPIELDAAGLSFADADGIAALRSLIGHGGQLQNCSRFISELLRETNHAPPESCL